jgi:hypothetical protein
MTSHLLQCVSCNPAPAVAIMCFYIKAIPVSPYVPSNFKPCALCHLFLLEYRITGLWSV